MRTSRGLRVAAGLLLPLLLPVLPAAAETTVPIGGDRLAARGVVAPQGAPKLPAVSAASWLVADLDTGDVLASKNPHGRFAPASTLKTLTAATLIPKLDPAALVTPSWHDVNVDGSKVGLVEHVKYPVKELFTAMLVVSGNDAANTLASANGGISKTVAEMNAEAARLRAFDTHAVNANGLDDPAQLTSAYDLALIGRAGMQLPAFRRYVATKNSHVRGRGKATIPISSHDRLLWNYPGAIGIKNGYTVKAQATFVGAATRGGHTLIVTLLRTNPRYWPEAAALLDWGFAATRAGVTPVGTLVNPVDTDPTPEPAPVRPAATAKLSPAKDSGIPLLPTGIVGAGVTVIAGSLLRGRRRGRHRKLTLPPL
jgi:D-alanyl-D-alanine carboxypeptidase (penicillin-binding protein 5/6)